MMFAKVIARNGTFYFRAETQKKLEEKVYRVAYVQAIEMISEETYNRAQRPWALLQVNSGA